jgi:ABC-type nickel/cobalt efflux system permease component RcnA
VARLVEDRVDALVYEVSESATVHGHGSWGLVESGRAHHLRRGGMRRRPQTTDHARDHDRADALQIAHRHVTIQACDTLHQSLTKRILLAGGRSRRLACGDVGVGVGHGVIWLGRSGCECGVVRRR